MKVAGRTSGWNAPTYNLLDKMENGKTYAVSLKVRSVAGQAAAGHTISVNISMRRDADGETKYDTILWQQARLFHSVHRKLSTALPNPMLLY